MLQIITDHNEFEALIAKAVQSAIDKIPQQPVVKPDIITLETLSVRLAVGQQTLLKWRKKGKIPYLSLGANIRYDFNKVIEALEVVNKKGVSI